MSDDKLVFNGVRPDGSYALAPQTAKQLADRVWAARRREEALAKQLQAAFDSAEKTVEIVDFLVAESERFFAGDALTRELWFTGLARQLLKTILGETYATTTNVQALAGKLADDTQKKIRSIVTALAKQGRGVDQSALEGLLLPQRADGDTSYKELLKQQVEHWGSAIRNELLSPDKAKTLQDEPGARAAWLAELCRRLRELPIESLKRLTEHRGIVSTPLKRLVSELRTVPDASRPWATRLIQDVEPISLRGRHASWPGVVDVLAADLDPIARADGPNVAWEGLLTALATWLQTLFGAVAKLGVVAWVDPKKLEETGWGVIFPAKMDEVRRAAIMAALDPLLKLRRVQATRKDAKLYRVFAGKPEGVRPNDDARAFLRRFGASASEPADPEKTGIPYYLLLVGSPEEISFEFQYGLDVQYAVGRIDFGDDWEAYARYARSVVAAEADDFEVSPEVTFVAVENKDDKATKLSTEHLVAPIVRGLEGRLAGKREPGAGPAWVVNVVPPVEATQSKLLEIVRQEHAPAFLFTASHGLEVEPDDPEQQAKQGALVCADWKGEGHPLDEGGYLSGDALAKVDGASLLGTIAFLFACYGAGTPKTDDYYRQDFEEKGEVIARQPFVASLPKAMLSLQKGGALAVVGHVERVWSLSFLGPEQRSGLGEVRRAEHTAVFESMIERLLDGHPIGSAMDYFDVRYAALSTELTAAFDAFREPDEFELAELWTANHDARGYVVIGDPAVRLWWEREGAAHEPPVQ